ncbi:MAG: hypothetical protein ABIL46_04345 [candidate division WOR-3 bacterium]
MIILFILNIFENFLFPDFTITTHKFNPANLVEQKFCLTLGGIEKFGISELRVWNADLQFRSFSLKLSSFGNELYRENFLEFAGGFLLYRTISGGISLGFLNNWIKEYTNRYAYTIKLGGTFFVSNLKFDLCLNNVNYPRFSNTDFLPLSYVIGFNYNVSGQIEPYCYVMGEGKNRPFLKLGAIIKVTRLFELSTGISTENFLFDYGMRIYLGRIFLDYSGSSHRQLGLTHAIFINIIKL